MLVTHAAAQPAPAPEQSEAARLFDEGRSLAEQGKYADACERFQQSFDLDHATGTELNLGDCHEHLQHFKLAVELFTTAGDELDRAGKAPRAKIARDRAAAAAAKLATVIVKVPTPHPAGLEITIGGKVVAATPDARDKVDPGSVEIVARAPGHEPYTTTAQPQAATTVVIELPRFAEPGGEIPPITAATDRRRSRIRLAWGFTGVAGASAIAGLVFGIAGHDRWNSAVNSPDCHRLPSGAWQCDAAGLDAVHDSQQLADVATGLAIGAGVVGAVAAALYFTAPHDVVVTPTIGLHGAGVALDFHF